MQLYRQLEGNWRPYDRGCRQCVRVGVACIDAIGMAHGCEEYNGYGDDPKHPHAGASFTAAAARLTIGWLPVRSDSDSLYRGSGERVSAEALA